MKIKRVSLANFKSFTEQVNLTRISEGTNIIIGRNGAGKSSILMAIRLIIDAHQKLSPTERNRLINEKEDNGTASIEIEFENTLKAFPKKKTLLQSEEHLQKKVMSTQ